MDSIDIFDTAIFRDVYQPTDIFQLIEDAGSKNFKQKRIDAENRAYKQFGFPNIYQIYKFLVGYDPQIEINMEMKHVYANPKILEMYKKCPNKYVFISDMYLPSKVLVEMLEKCGYENPKVFVSCEEKCIKGTGVLFEKVIRRVGSIDKHYGDNYKADIEQSAKHGITPIFTPALHKLDLNLPAVKNPMLKKYAAVIESNEGDPLNRLVMYFAPLIYYFTKWVIDQRKPGQSIYFVSRDMFMPYAIAHEILKVPDVYYLHCSRKALSPLVLNGREKLLIDKMHTIFGPEVCKQKKAEGTKDCLDYLKSVGIKNNDMIVDIGYSGTSQKIIEDALKIKLVGRYMQLGAVPSQYSYLDTKQYLNRMALIYIFLAEFVMTSPEDNMEGYKNGKPYFTPDHQRRKDYAKDISKMIINEKLCHKILNMNLSLFDIEQMLIHVQNNPGFGIIEMFNESIFANRKLTESGVNFNREAILNGKLFEYYAQSYAKPYFIEMLKRDPQLSSLIKLLPR